MRKGKRIFASRKRKVAGLLAFVLAGVVGVGAYAFTAANTLPESNAGVGTQTVKPYTVSEVKYTFGSNPVKAKGVTFKLNEAASSVVAALTVGTPVTADWGPPCVGEVSTTEAVVANEVVECEFPAEIELESATKLSVTAVSGGKLP